MWREPDPYCALCEGDGFIADQHRQQTHPCPLCTAPWPTQPASRTTWLESCEQIPARWHGHIFNVPPTQLVIHRAASNGDIAHYFADPSDGRKVSAHFVIRPNGVAVQCVPLNTVAWHAGPANSMSLGIELSGAIDTDFEPLMLDRLVALVVELRSICPSLATVLGHVDLCPWRRRDPGANFPWAQLAGLGLSSPHF